MAPAALVCSTKVRAHAETPRAALTALPRSPCSQGWETRGVPQSSGSPPDLSLIAESRYLVFEEAHLCASRGRELRGWRSPLHVPECSGKRDLSTSTHCSTQHLLPATGPTQLPGCRLWVGWVLWLVLGSRFGLFFFGGFWEYLAVFRAAVGSKPCRHLYKMWWSVELHYIVTIKIISYGRQTRWVSYKHRCHTAECNTDTDAQAMVFSHNKKITSVNKDCTMGSIYPTSVKWKSLLENSC